MADQLGLSQSAYSELETDQTELSYSRLSKIAELLQVSISDIENFDEKVIFNVNINDSASQNSVNYNQNHYYSDRKVIELLENQIRLLEDKLRYLEEKVRGGEGK